MTTRHYGVEKPSLEDTLAHFGVLGMKWGIRKGASKTGVGRIRAGAAQALMDESRRRNTVSRSHLGSHAYGALGVFAPVTAVLRTSGSQRRIAARQQRAASRILKGQTKTMDFLRALKNTSLFDIAVTTTVQPHGRQYSGDKGALNTKKLSKAQKATVALTDAKGKKVKK